jgi:prevent-host-death family protein
MARLTATDVARNFSDVVSRVAAGEEIEITRNGAIVAVLGPPKARLLSPERFRELMENTPKIDDRFAADLRAIRADIPPPETAWPS